MFLFNKAVSAIRLSIVEVFNKIIYSFGRQNHFKGTILVPFFLNMGPVADLDAKLYSTGTSSAKT
jgi:hypothetical protein